MARYGTTHAPSSTPSALTPRPTRSTPAPPCARTLRADAAFADGGERVAVALPLGLVALALVLVELDEAEDPEADDPEADDEGVKKAKERHRTEFFDKGLGGGDFRRPGGEAGEEGGCVGEWAGCVRVSIHPAKKSRKREGVWREGRTEKEGRDAGRT
ncbi:hypothetical protein C8R45DRAFT_930561 [Mycena sanguinolenta]|nr:hypothetical protein C8R45DRAFT_930561 [Mycena sanguinolenta]